MATSTRNDERLMSPKEVADYLNIKVSHLYDKWREWQLPAIKVGNLLRFRRRDVEAWLDGRLTGA